MLDLQGPAHRVDALLHGGVGDCRRVTVVLENGGFRSGNVDVVYVHALAVEHAGDVDGAGGEGVQLDVEPHGRHLAHALRHFFLPDAVIQVHVLCFNGAGVVGGQMTHPITGKALRVREIQAVQRHAVGAVVEFKNVLRQVHGNLAHGEVDFLCRDPGGIRLAAQLDISAFNFKLSKGDFF